VRFYLVAGCLKPGLRQRHANYITASLQQQSLVWAGAEYFPKSILATLCLESLALGWEQEEG
jgi:hypothetical protein